MQSIKKIYLYLVSVIALIIMVIGGIMLLNMALKTWLFTKADKDLYLAPCPTMVDKPEVSTCDEPAQRKLAEENRVAQKQRDAAQALAMLIVATPVWYFHWRLAKREV